MVYTLYLINNNMLVIKSNPPEANRIIIIVMIPEFLVLDDRSGIYPRYHSQEKIYTFVHNNYNHNQPKKVNNSQGLI